MSDEHEIDIGREAKTIVSGGLWVLPDLSYRLTEEDEVWLGAMRNSSSLHSIKDIEGCDLQAPASEPGSRPQRLKWGRIPPAGDKMSWLMAGQTAQFALELADKAGETMVLRCPPRCKRLKFTGTLT